VLCEGQKVVASIDHKEGSLMHLRLMDPNDPAAHDPLVCINADLLHDGLAAMDRKLANDCPFIRTAQAMGKLQEAVADAKRG
jgi:staphylococcal nuclease domain-containing protein 1